VVPEALVHSEQMVKEVLSIPIEPLFEESERERVVQTIIRFFSKR
jgi:dTDP-4-amino-4,6-dideoxygalactose transaminase